MARLAGGEVTVHNVEGTRFGAGDICTRFNHASGSGGPRRYSCSMHNSLDAAAVEKFDPKTLHEAYARVRTSLSRDPLFIEDAHTCGVSLAQLDEKMAAAPSTPTLLWDWLDGADQYRYAALAVLGAAYPPTASVRVDGSAIVPDNVNWVIAGDVAISGNLEIASQAMLFVTGTLRIEGNLMGPSFDFSCVAAQRIEFASAATYGELIALDAVVATGDTYLYGNDYSCRAPLFCGKKLVDFERENAFTQVKVEARLEEWDFPAAHAMLEISEGDDDLANKFIARLRQ